MYIMFWADIKRKLKLLIGIFFTSQETYEQMWLIRLLLSLWYSCSLATNKLNVLSYFTHTAEGLVPTVSQYKANAQVKKIIRKAIV